MTTYRCAYCHSVRNEPDMLQSKGVWYCCIQCKIKSERTRHEVTFTERNPRRSLYAIYDKG